MAINEKIRYGVCVEVKGKYAGVKHKVISVCRPCLSVKEGSLKASLDVEFRGKFEE